MCFSYKRKEGVGVGDNYLMLEAVMVGVVGSG